MDRTPLVSVIMPVYNTVEYLEEAVESILGQTMEDLELIIVDDGSTDGSARILDRYRHSDARVRGFHQENKGIVSALNGGLELAGGKYVARMDSDDISLPDRLARQVEFMESHPEVGVCGTACRMFGDSQGVTRPKLQSEEIKSWLLFGPCMAHPTVMMRRDLIEKHNLYYDPGFKQAEDYQLWVRFSRHTEMANLPEPLLLYRVRTRQATNRFRSDIHMWSGLVQSEALESLELEPSDDDLELHLSLHTGHFEKTREYVERVDEWLTRLLVANRNWRIRDEKAFAGTLFEVWRAVCAAEVELGPWMWRKFTSSEIFRVGGPASGSGLGRSLALPKSALNFLRAYASISLEKTRTGRSFKRIARTVTSGELRLAGNGGQLG